MKYASVRLCAFLAAATAVTSICAVQPVIVEAQSSRLTANIPFAFHVGRDVLPAGKYNVREIVGSAVQLLSVTGDRAAAISTIPIWNADGRVSKLVFNRYGNDYFLSEVHWRGTSSARSLVKSPVELELAKTTSRRVIESIMSR
jgi:hypothetical protein